MKGKQLARKRRRAGVAIDTKRGKGGHYLLTYRGRQTTLPMHGDTDLGPVFIKKICRQLGLDPEEIF